MRMLALGSLALALAVGCADAATGTTQLTVIVWPEGRQSGASTRWTLRCNPPGGTHPAARRACARLAELERPFAPVPKDAVCTQVFGGPQEALVTGIYRGQKVWTRFNRRDGCQIARWNRHVPLLPSGAA